MFSNVSLTLTKFTFLAIVPFVDISGIKHSL